MNQSTTPLIEEPDSQSIIETTDQDAELCQPYAIPDRPYHFDDPSECPLNPTFQEFACGDLIVRMEFEFFDGFIYFWDAETGKLVGYLQCPADLGSKAEHCGRCLSWGRTLGHDYPYLIECTQRYPCAQFETPPTSHKPFCDKTGTEEEGWYWGDSRELIANAKCKTFLPECVNLGTSNEGWELLGTIQDALFIPDSKCHQLSGRSYKGEPCSFEALKCFSNGESGDFLFCNYPLDESGSPIPGRTGVCMSYGSCEKESDCLHPNNPWTPHCDGDIYCLSGYCQVQNCK